MHKAYPQRIRLTQTKLNRTLPSHCRRVTSHCQIENGDDNSPVFLRRQDAPERSLLPHAVGEATWWQPPMRGAAQTPVPPPSYHRSSTAAAAARHCRLLSHTCEGGQRF